MNGIWLEPMTCELARRYYREFELDPDLFLDKEKYRPYEYSPEKSDATVERYKAMGRVFMAVMLDKKPVGEVVLKEIDYVKKCCAMGISMINNAYKNKGYGTAAEILILKYAFEILGMDTVYADAVITNVRSQRVLQKVGFTEVCRDANFVYYRYDRNCWRGINVSE